MQIAATMNHIALMLSPRLNAMAASANVPSATTPSQMTSDSGRGKPLATLVAIPTNPPAARVVHNGRQAADLRLRYRSSGRVVYSTEHGRRHAASMSGEKGSRIWLTHC